MIETTQKDYYNTFIIMNNNKSITFDIEKVLIYRIANYVKCENKLHDIN